MQKVNIHISGVAQQAPDALMAYAAEIKQEEGERAASHALSSDVAQFTMSLPLNAIIAGWPNPA
jgi:hypothetical protein